MPDRDSLASAKAAHAARPDDAGPRGRLLAELLASFRAAEEAWPEGLRLGDAPADLEGCRVLLEDVKLARGLDPEGRHRDFLDVFQARVNILVGQLRSDTGRCFF